MKISVALPESREAHREFTKQMLILPDREECFSYESAKIHILKLQLMNPQYPLMLSDSISTRHEKAAARGF